MSMEGCDDLCNGCVAVLDIFFRSGQLESLPTGECLSSSVILRSPSLWSGHAGGMIGLR